MKLAAILCSQCGEITIGTLERIEGVALMNIDEDGTADYAGETEIDWNSQQTVEDTEGNITLCCQDGHAWKSRREE